MKVCIKCGLPKPLTDFRADAKGRRRGDCKQCAADYQKAHYAKDPEKHCAASRKWVKEHPEQHAATKKAWRQENPEKHEAYTRKTHYGIADADFQSLLASQKGLCAICGGPPTKARKNLSVDHCHSTGKVRGLLCGPCNTGIGQLKDSPDLLLKAHAYLLRFSS